MRSDQSISSLAPDAWHNDLMVCNIERGLFKGLDLTKIKEEF
jgi:hypothetical protein